MSIIKTVLVILMAASAATSHSQPGYRAEDKISPEHLKSDFTILKQVLEGVHIGLYRYSSKKTIDSLFTTCYSKLNEPMTEIEFFSVINPLIVAIRDEHTFALPSDNYMKNEIGQTTYSASSSASKSKLFPFFVKLIDNKLYIENNLSADTALHIGDEIVSINGQSSAQVVNVLLATVATNGFSQTFRQRHLEQFSLQQTYNRFMVHYAIFIGRPDFFELRIRKAGRDIEIPVKVEALTSATIFNYYWRRYSSVNDPKKKKENPLEFKMLNTSTAYLRLSDFHTPVWAKYNYSFSTEFRTIFELVKKQKVQNLVVDLRGNEGGNLSIGVEALKYLCVKSFRPYDYHEVINYKFPALKKYFRDSTAAPNYPDEVFSASGNTYRSNPQYKTEAMSRSMEPATERYNNKVYVLTDGATGSAAAMFATLIRVNRRDAIFVGEECGGDIEGPISGGGTDIILPNSRIRVDIPFIKRVVNLEGYPHQKGRGIMPDHLVKPTIKAMINGEDSVLQYTLSLIGRKK